MIYQNPNYCMGNRSTLEKFKVALGVLANPWMLFFDKARFVKKPRYKTKPDSQRGSVMLFTRGGTTDVNDAVVVLSGKEYPPELIGLGSSFQKNDSPVILDCGGHIGSFTLLVKSLVPNAQITAMEPVPDNQKLFIENITLNNFQGITLVPFALYGQSGTFYIDLAGKQFDAVNVTSVKPQHSEYITINALTLDEVVSQNHLEKIDLLKMDIEGAEYNIFTHSLEALSKHVARLIMEFHPAGDTAKRDEIYQRLCVDGPFELIYETKNILGFSNKNLNERSE